jgi:hypothetical protein
LASSNWDATLDHPSRIIGCGGQVVNSKLLQLQQKDLSDYSGVFCDS